MRAFLLGLIGSAAMFGTAVASAGPEASAAVAKVAEAQRSARIVYICEDTAASRRAFIREFGTAEFVTAKKALARGANWDAPKCMTGAEFRRFKAMQRSVPLTVASAR
jgi:hypothetical protein